MASWVDWADSVAVNNAAMAKRREVILFFSKRIGIVCQTAGAGGLAVKAKTAPFGRGSVTRFGCVSEP